MFCTFSLIASIKLNRVTLGEDWYCIKIIVMCNIIPEVPEVSKCSSVNVSKILIFSSV